MALLVHMCNVPTVLAKAFLNHWIRLTNFLLPGFGAISIRFIYLAYIAVFCDGTMALSEVMLLYSQAKLLHLFKSLCLQSRFDVHQEVLCEVVPERAILVSLSSSFLDTCYSLQISFKKSKNLNMEKQWRYFCPSPGIIQQSCRSDIQCNPSNPE